MRALKRMNMRLHKEGRWEAYKLFREEVRRLLPHIAPELDPDHFTWRIASFRFKPLDGTPHEVSLSPQIEKFLTGAPLPMLEQVLPLPPATPAPPVEVVDDDGPYLDGTIGTRDEPNEPKYTPESLGIPQPPTAKTADGRTWTVYESGTGKETIVRKLNINHDWDELRKLIDRTKRCKPYDMIMWVFEHMDDAPQEIDPEDVPSRGVLSYLKLCQDNPTAKTDFMTKIYPKSIPDKKQLEHESKQSDDGRPQLRLIAQLDEEFAKEESAA
jgi:hypothetical protein